MSTVQPWAPLSSSRRNRSKCSIPMKVGFLGHFSVAVSWSLWAKEVLGTKKHPGTCLRRAICLPAKAVWSGGLQWLDNWEAWVMKSMTATVTTEQGSTYRWLWCDCDWPNLYDHLAFYYLSWLEFHLIQKSQSSRGSQTRCLVGAQLALKMLRKQNLAFTPCHGLRKSGLATTCSAWEVRTMKCDTQNDVDLWDRTSPKVKFLEVWNAYAKCKSNF